MDLGLWSDPCSTTDIPCYFFILINSFTSECSPEAYAEIVSNLVCSMGKNTRRLVSTFSHRQNRMQWHSDTIFLSCIGKCDRVLPELPNYWPAGGRHTPGE